jgi:metacaspase-1
MNYLLSVGINHYKMNGHDLQGCVADTTDIRKTLAELYGFSVLGIKILQDQNATKEAIMTALSTMVLNAVKGDHLVYHHSSHGSQVQDVDGDEPDQLDEILCPYDFDWDKEHYICDDELRALFCKLKRGVTLDVVLDACHSETGTRSLNTNSKCITPIIDLKGNVSIKRLLRNDLPSGVTLWAGCKADQTSADAFIDGAYHGAMTYYFCQSLRKTDGNISRSHLYSHLKQAIKGYEQIPQLECSMYRRYRRIFT